MKTVCRWLNATIAIRYTADNGTRRTIAVSRAEVWATAIALMVVGAFVIRDVIRFWQWIAQ